MSYPTVQLTRLITILSVAVLAAACGGGASETVEAPKSAALSSQANEVAGAAASGRGTVAPEYREVTLPAGTTLRLELRSAVASDTSSIEDPVRATLRQPVVIGGETVI